MMCLGSNVISRCKGSNIWYMFQSYFLAFTIIISIVFIWIFNWIINLLLDFCCQPDEGKSQSHTTTVNIVLQSCRICPHFWYCSKVILLVYRITHYTQSSCTYIALYPTNQIWKIAKRSYLRAFSKTVPKCGSNQNQIKSFFSLKIWTLMIENKWCYFYLFYFFIKKIKILIYDWN